MITVLYVDDESVLLEVTRLFLEKTGEFLVDTALSVQDALDKLRKGSYDVIVSDFQMPGTNGIEFLKALRADGNKTPFIIFTGRGREEIAIEALNSGADFYIQKGGNPKAQYAELRSKILQATALRQAELRIVYLSRVNSLLSQVNKSIVRIRNRDELFSAICTVAVEYGRFRMAWIGITDTATRQLRPVAWAGFGAEEYLHNLTVSVDDIPTGKGPSGRAVREGTAIVSNDIPHDPLMQPWQEPARKAGYSSSGAFPLFCKGHVIGALSLYAMEPDFFSHDEMELLKEVSADISFSLDNQERDRERLVAIEALRQSEEKYRTLVETSFDGIVIHQNGSIVYANAATARLLGFNSAENLLGKPILPFVHPDYRALANRRIESATREAQPVIKEKILRADGTAIDADVVAIPLSWKNQPAVHVVFRDITERQKSEDAQRQNEAKSRLLAAIVDSSDDAIIGKTLEGVITSWNKGAEKIYGYAAHEIIGKSITILIPPDHENELPGILEKIRQGVHINHYETVRIRKDGVVLQISLTISPIQDENGTIIGASTIGRDISEKKQAEEHISQQYQFLQQLIDSIPNPVFYKDVNEVYTGCNRAFELYTGLHKEQIIGKSVYQIAPKELADKYHISDKNLFESPGTQTYEAQVQYADGSRHEVIFYKATFSDLQGNIAGIVGIILDITKLKRIEEELWRSRQLLAAAMDLAQIVSWDYDVATDMFTFDDRFFAFHATTAEREGGYRMPAQTYIRKFVYPDDIPAVTRGIKNSQNITDPNYRAQIEHRIVRRDGAVRTIIVQVAPVMGSDNRIVRAYGANQDITERRNAEEVLRQSEERYRTLFTNMLEGFEYCRMLYDEAGHPQDFVFLNVNPAFTRIIGKTDIAGKKATEVFPGIKDEIPELFEQYGRVALTGQPASFDFEFKPSGKWLHISAYSPAKDHFVAVSQDITDRRLAEERLKKAEEKYRNIVENALDGIYQISPKGHFLTANPAMARILGYDSVDDLITSVTDTAHQLWVHQEERKDYLLQLRKNDTIEDFECEFFRKDKSPIWVALTTHTVRGADKTLRYSEGILVDITRRKKAERELIDRESEYRTILHTTMDGFCILSLDGKFLDVNDAFCRLTGYSRDELLVRSLVDIEALENAETIAEHSRKIVRKGEDRFETRYRRNDGSLIDVEVSVVATDRHGGQFFTFHHDITERKRIHDALISARNDLERKVLERTSELKNVNESLQEEIERRKEADIKNVASLREKEMLLKEIHHRVKNNMQVISSLLFMQARAQKDETIKGILKESQDRIKSIALVHEKLYQSTELDRIDYTDYLRKITDHLFESYRIDPSVIRLTLNSENAVLHIDKAVPCSLIINELISNSLKHAFPGGRKGTIAIDFRKGPDRYILTYSDDGVGIPESVTFDRTESMGMQLIKGLTKQINGSIDLDRTAGTKYTITFPA